MKTPTMKWSKALGFYTFDAKRHAREARKARKQLKEKKRKAILHAMSKI